ncbi:helix-turn-helix transcriptional regulator [Streptomyces sp. NBC_01728]|uniref:helix-turn-helix domain-containing protein n=1 Tax=unclassified Streptomyces TaxID=2593676 RepID=UPI00224FDD1A|nr:MULTISPECIES: helix-turn-helix transcriptional regulator [unclassified Streptomyces]MCX4459370.1 helix-turn-helix transcriptional regulator [Streptomyces sp. NBC_01719]MCX4498727.1 helix-turn-helix transcriptional regulator [Streptomyces sp. NBC_01728]
MSNQAPNAARVIPLRPATAPATRPAAPAADAPPRPRPALAPRQVPPEPGSREPLWRDLMGDVLRRERLAQERTLKDVADAARISMPYLSELERGRKEASSEVLAAAARALGLGLIDLLSLAQDELTRLAQMRPAHCRTPSASHHDGMCLAA